MSIGISVADRIKCAFVETYGIEGVQLPQALAEKITPAQPRDLARPPASSAVGQGGHLNAYETGSGDGWRALGKIDKAESIKPGLFWLHTDGSLKEATWANGRRLIGWLSRIFGKGDYAKRNAAGQALAALDFIKNRRPTRVEEQTIRSTLVEALTDLQRLDKGAFDEIIATVAKAYNHDYAEASTPQQLMHQEIPWANRIIDHFVQLGITQKPERPPPPTAQPQDVGPHQQPTGRGARLTSLASKTADLGRNASEFFNNSSVLAGNRAPSTPPTARPQQPLPTTGEPTPQPVQLPEVVAWQPIPPYEAPDQPHSAEEQQVSELSAQIPGLMNQAQAIGRDLFGNTEDASILRSRKKNRTDLVEALGANHEALRIPLVEKKGEGRGQQYELTIIDALAPVLANPTQVAPGRKRQFADAVVARYQKLGEDTNAAVGLPQNLNTPAKLVAEVLKEQRPGDIIASNRYPWSRA